MSTLAFKAPLLSLPVSLSTWRLLLLPRGGGAGGGAVAGASALALLLLSMRALARLMLLSMRCYLSAGTGLAFFAGVDAGLACLAGASCLGAMADVRLAVRLGKWLSASLRAAVTRAWPVVRARLCLHLCLPVRVCVCARVSSHILDRPLCVRGCRV